MEEQYGLDVNRMINDKQVHIESMLSQKQELRLTQNYHRGRYCS